MDTVVVKNALEFQVSSVPAYLEVVVTLLAAIAAFVALFWASHAWREAQKSSTASAVAMYFEFNRYVSEHIHLVGPLTPYHKDSNEDRIALAIRLYYLQLFNRWSFDLDNRAARAAHARFRRHVLGGDLRRMRDLITGRGYEPWIANLCVDVLLDIRRKEPYYDRRFWEVYFNKFRWT